MRYIFIIDHIPIFIPDYVFNYPRYRAIQVISNIVEREGYARYFNIAPDNLAKKIYIMYLSNNYFEEIHRVQYMIQFSSKQGKKYDPFLESRVWMYIKGEIPEDKERKLIDFLRQEAWYQLIVCPSIIIALAEDAVVYKEGYENEIIEPDEIPKGSKFNVLYRLIVNYKTDYVFTHERIKCDLHRLETNIKEYAMFTKEDIIQKLKRGEFEAVMRMMWWIWKITPNCETNAPMWGYQ